MSDYPLKSVDKIQVSASVMCANFLELGRELKQLEDCGVNYLHCDVMDAHFVPNMPLGLEIIHKLSSATSIPIDVHLMVENNTFFIERLKDSNIHMISFHVESEKHLDRVVALIKNYGIKAGLALNPGTPLEALDYVREQLDFILLMTVNPGFAGQKLASSAIRKIAECRAYLNRHNLNIPISVDGNVSFENIPEMVIAGADILVAGTSSLFKKGSELGDNMCRLLKAATVGLPARSKI